MNKLFLLWVLTLTLIPLVRAQNVVMDTVSQGASYGNQIWYSLPNDNQGTALKNNWDIAFETSGFGYSILMNSITGTTLWNYAKSDTTGWSSIDTTGLSTWKKRYNSDTSWAYGAFSRYTNGSSTDLDWGIYSTITHNVTGDSLYIIKLASGAYKKLWIKSLISGVYTFTYADLNGSNLQTATITKSTYNTKSFIYYSLQTNAIVDREPAKSSWDLTFTQYTAFIPTPYTVAGVLQNTGVRVADCRNIANTTTYSNYNAHTLKTSINEIGYDWKTFTGSAWAIEDSLVYFVRRTNGDIWKMIFTGFGGSGNGNHIFSKELLSYTDIKDNTESLIAQVSLYPNPMVTGNNVTLVYNLEKPLTTAQLTVLDLQGKQHYTTVLQTQTGMYTQVIPSTELPAGMYIIALSLNNQTHYQKLIIQ